MEHRLADGGMAVQDARLERVERAVAELADGEMSITGQSDGTFLVKGSYTVDLDGLSCTCPDHEHNERFCKHIVAVRLQSMWGNVDIPMTDARPPKPDVLTPKLENVPQRLRDVDQWVAWKQDCQENKDGTQRWTKVPISPVGHGYASSTDPETWGTFTDAIREFNVNGDVVGVGVVLTESDPFIGVDIDDCRDPETGEITPGAVSVLSGMHTYVEVSPSGTGIRGFVRGTSDAPGACEGSLPGDAHIEKYVTGRYLTVTGHRLPSVPETVTDDETTVRIVDRQTAGEGV